jgi:predicted PurR-regulated permease PerM
MARVPDTKAFDRKVLRVLMLSSAYLALIYLIILLKTPLIWLAIAFFFALAMEPGVKKIQSRTPIKSRGFAAFIIILAAVALVLFIAITIIPPLVNQTRGFVHSAPAYIEKLQHSNNGLIKSLNRHGELSKINIDSRKVLDGISNHRHIILGAVSSVASVITSIVTILVLTFFIILELPQISKAFWRYHPAGKRRHRQELGAQMHKVIIGTVNGNLLTSLLAAIGSAAVLAILHIPYAIPLGLLVGLIDLIPLVWRPHQSHYPSRLLFRLPAYRKQHPTAPSLQTDCTHIIVTGSGSRDFWGQISRSGRSPICHTAGGYRSNSDKGLSGKSPRS